MATQNFSALFPPTSLATLGGVALTDWRTGQVLSAKTRSYISMIGAAADGFFDQTGIDVANSVNAYYDSTRLLYNNNDPYTKALLHFDGANGATTFSDDAGHTFSATGSPTISTAQSVFGGASLRLPGSAYLTTPASADFGVGTGDFTIEFRFRPDAIGTEYDLFDTRASSGGSGITVAILSSGKAYVFDGTAGAGAITGATTLSASTWYAFAVTRTGGTLRLFVNGNVDGSQSNTSNFGTSNPLTIGANVASQNSSVGYMDELRFTNGLARYTAAYTPATSAFTIAGASLDLRSTTFSAGFTPTKGSLFFLLNPLNGGAINAASGGNLVASLSQNGGTAYTTMPLTLSGTTLAGFPIYEANGVALGGSGTQPKWRLQTSGGLGIEVRGAYFKEQ